MGGWFYVDQLRAISVAGGERGQLSVILDSLACEGHLFYLFSPSILSPMTLNACVDILDSIRVV
jgi:hypothetical protein